MPPVYVVLYFKNSEVNSDKFWRVGGPEHVKVNMPGHPGAWRVVVGFGRRGTSGQTKVKYFETEAEARAWIKAQVVNKKRHGYAEDRKDLAAVAVQPVVEAPGRARFFDFEETKP